MLGILGGFLYFFILGVSCRGQKRFRVYVFGQRIYKCSLSFFNTFNTQRFYVFGGKDLSCKGPKGLGFMCLSKDL